MNFSDKSNNLSGTANFEPWYRTSKTRVCVTVGMMTTGYDCTDILNICLMRPIFSPTDFIQIKGRGTRKHNFTVRLLILHGQKRLGRLTRRNSSSSTFLATMNTLRRSFSMTRCLKLPFSIKRENDW